MLPCSGMPAHTRDATRHVPEAFGPYIRTLRERAGLLIAEMASRCGVSASHYGRIECGDKAPLDETRWSPLLEIGAEHALLNELLQDYMRARRASRRSRSRHDRDAIAAGHPGSSSWDDLPWEEDDWCWFATTCHPNGLTIEQVGALTGLTSERVRQVEMEALAKLAVEPDAVEAMEVIDDRENELAIWTVAANVRSLESQNTQA